MRLDYTSIQQKHPNLSTTAFCVLLAISDRMKKKGQNDTDYPVSQLSMLMGVGRRLIIKSINMLEDEGLLIVDRSGRSSIYSIPHDVYIDHKPAKSCKNKKRKPHKPEAVREQPP